MQGKGSDFFHQNNMVLYGRKRTRSGPIRNSTFGGKRAFASSVSRRATRSQPSFARRVRALNGYKHAVVSDNSMNASMLYQQVYSNPILTSITQGTTNATRIGDSVFLASLKLSGILVSPAASGAYAYRVIVGWSTVQDNTFNNTAGVTVTSLFLPGSYTGLTYNGIINPKAFTAIMDKTFDVPSVVPLTQDAVTLKETIPLNQNYDWVSSGSVYGKFKNLYLVVIPYVAGGTSFVTPAGSYAISADICFQEMK